MSKIRYVYIYLNPMKPGKFEYNSNEIGICFLYEPFYVGKGTGYRLNSHLTEEKNGKIKINKHKINTISKIKENGLKPIIIKLIEDFDHDYIKNLEYLYISTIGRSFINKGPLTNILPGGDSGPDVNTFLKDKTYDEAYGIDRAKLIKRKSVDGRLAKSGYTSGNKHHYYGCHRTEEVKQKISKTKKERGCHIGNKNSMYGKKGELCPNYGRKHTEEELKKMSEKQKGKVFTEEHKYNIGSVRRIYYNLIDTDNNSHKFYGLKELKLFCITNNMSFAYLKKHINKGKVPKTLPHYELANNCFNWEIKADYTK